MSLTREFSGSEIMEGIKRGIVSRDVLLGRPVTFDERLKLEDFLLKKGGGV